MSAPSVLATTAEEFAALHGVRVRSAERSLAKAQERHADAMREYEAEVARHAKRGDGFFSAEYHAARSDAVRAAKSLRTRQSALNTARAKAEAPTLATNTTQEDPR